MKHFNVQKIGLEIMQPDELREHNGGSLIGWIVSAVIGGLLYDIVSNPKESAQSFKEGMDYDPFGGK